MAKTRINSMDTPFNPASYHDEYQVKLRQLIEDKINGKEIVEPKGESAGNVIDLMEALQASIDQTKSTTKKATKSKGKKNHGNAIP